MALMGEWEQGLKKGNHQTHVSYTLVKPLSDSLGDVVEGDQGAKAIYGGTTKTCITLIECKTCVFPRLVGMFPLSFL